MQARERAFLTVYIDYEKKENNKKKKMKMVISLWLCKYIPIYIIS